MNMNEEAHKSLVASAEELRWRERQDGMERLLSALSWWLDTQGENSASMTIAGIQREFEFNREATSVLDHVLSSTDSASAEDLLERWTDLEKLEREALEGS